MNKFTHPISSCDSHLVAQIIMRCKEVMNEYSTISNMTALYNLMCQKFRLFCVSNSKKDCKDFAKEIYEQLLKEIDNFPETDEDNWGKPGKYVSGS